MREEAAQLEGGTLVGAEADATREGRPVDALAPPLGEPTRSQRRRSLIFLISNQKNSFNLLKL